MRLGLPDAWLMDDVEFCGGVRTAAGTGKGGDWVGPTAGAGEGPTAGAGEGPTAGAGVGTTAGGGEGRRAGGGTRVGAAVTLGVSNGDTTKRPIALQAANICETGKVVGGGAGVSGGATPGGGRATGGSAGEAIVVSGVSSASCCVMRSILASKSVLKLFLFTLAWTNAFSSCLFRRSVFVKVSFAFDNSVVRSRLVSAMDANSS
jgi:hypothetical protein